MDPTRFDALTRALTAAPERKPTRRSLLALLAGGLTAAGVLGGPQTAAKRRKKKCKGGKLKCNKVCIDPQTDFDNCGTCGNVCGQGQTCDNGTCSGGPPTDCTGQPDLTDCGGDQQCSGGVCATAPTCGTFPDQCASALDCCGNVCDPDAFCPLSAPGNPCRTTESCSDGATCVGFVCQ